MSVTTRPRKEPWSADLFIRGDTEVANSRHTECGSPVRRQWLSSIPAVVTDETAIASAEGRWDAYYCPACDVLVRFDCTNYKTETEYVAAK
jgi:hypothetical protein